MLFRSEFKMFLRWRGFNIDAGLFNIQLCEPQNFASYRQSALDQDRIGSFMQLEQLPYMSKRFMMKRFLGMSEEEIVENEKLWREERDTNIELQTTQGQDLRSIGITPAGLEQDITTGTDLAAGLEPGAELGGLAGAPGTTGATPPTAPAGGAGATPTITV